MISYRFNVILITENLYLETESIKSKIKDKSEKKSMFVCMKQYVNQKANAANADLAYYLQKYLQNQQQNVLFVVKIRKPFII